MLRYTLQKEKETMKNGMFKDEYQSHTADVLELCQEYFGTKRIVAIDALYSSVGTACAALKYGLFVGGIVKQNTSQFPNQFINDWGEEIKKKYPTNWMGRHIVLTSSTNNNSLEDLMAIGWLIDKKCFSYITTFGSSKPGETLKRYRTSLQPGRTCDDNEGEIPVATLTESLTKMADIPRPDVLAHIMSNLSSIDVHNHYRQGSLGMEQLYTKLWEKRLLFFFIGSATTDGFLAQCYENNMDYKLDAEINFQEYCCRLTEQLINNPFDLANNEVRQFQILKF